METFLSAAMIDHQTDDMVAQGDPDGAEVEVQICPEFRNSRDLRSLKAYFDLSRFSIMLPGNIGCTVGQGEKDGKLKSLPPLEFEGAGLECKNYGFTFPRIARAQQ